MPEPDASIPAIKAYIRCLVNFSERMPHCQTHKDKVTLLKHGLMEDVSITSLEKGLLLTIEPSRLNFFVLILNIFPYQIEYDGEYLHIKLHTLF